MTEAVRYSGRVVGSVAEQQRLNMAEATPVFRQGPIQQTGPGVREAGAGEGVRGSLCLFKPTDVPQQSLCVCVCVEE